MVPELPYWLLNTVITGREENDDSGNEDDEGNNAEDDGEEDEDEGEGGSGGSGSSDDDVKARADALEKALREERKLRRKAEREAKRASKQKDNDAEEKDLEAARREAEEARQKTLKLAERLRNSSVDSAILEEARNQGFIDPTDALLDDVRNEVDVDQDEDDPSDIDIDPDTVKAAVMKLAKKKKHLIAKPNDGERSGSRFRKKQGENGSTDEANLKTLYPSLR